MRYGHTNALRMCMHDDGHLNIIIFIIIGIFASASSLAIEESPAGLDFERASELRHHALARKLPLLGLHFLLLQDEGLDLLGLRDRVRCLPRRFRGRCWCRRWELLLVA